VDSIPQWYEFTFGGVGVMARGPQPADPLGGFIGVPGVNAQAAPAPPWTFTAGPTGVNFDVTDSFDPGDAFEIRDFGNPIGMTNMVPVGPQTEINPDPSFANPAYSHGTFFLDPGPHSITIFPTASPFGGGRLISGRRQRLLPALFRNRAAPCCWEWLPWQSAATPGAAAN
jgi:hypothetical protein